MEQEVAGGSITAEWASLQRDLVQLVADCVLSTSGVDGYVPMRAVCPSWRSAVAKPSPHAAVADPRFRPRQWVVLHGADDDQARPLFLDVSTGRFRRLRRPVLGDYILIGASDGLLVLGDRERPHAARLLNPLTGDMLPFAAPIPPEDWVNTAIVGSEPTIIFAFEPEQSEYQDIPAYCSLQQGSDAVYSADPTGQLRAVKFHDAAYDKENLLYLQSMVTHAGNVYVLICGGTLCKVVWTGGHWYAELIMEIDMPKHCYTGCLVEFAGKLLLVNDKVETIELLCVDVNRKVLEPIQSIGRCALFLSVGKCMVVNADKLPTIMRNCIYMNFNDTTYVCMTSVMVGKHTSPTPGCLQMVLELKVISFMKAL
ncbi:hypothetical protein CFC21_047052 [Triticum aestivum]|uniref:KIB1-4 beta-propeller domain-containing protein n=2 Tax=Triticum aestivum TaxID=4565 RepID=A0A9R1K0H8_WHEAT|nr:uncharacterized protein LOC123080783 [Triticum aestivum]KAF7036352.1 hypothetical protein CFC21_047052 [Triticum aestivum]